MCGDDSTPGCATCNSYYECLTCQSGYTLQQGTCYPSQTDETLNMVVLEDV